jgi:outer membrane receptor for ferrienterochelin and colicins
VLFNQTSHAGTDAALWIAQALNERWGFSVIGGTHWQRRSDLDDDGWTDLPMFRRVQVRPRLLWDNGAGRSILVTVGTMTEQRRGGTMPGAGAPDGHPFPEQLDTTRVDSGVLGRFLVAGNRVLAIRGSVSTSHHDRLIGSTVERDRSTTGLGEVSLTGTSGRHTWVGGGALQVDRFRAADVPRFNFTYVTPGLFAQDDVALSPQVTLSGGARVDRHNEFGTFLSPRISLLWRPAPLLTARVSTGRGHFAPQPFTEETEAAGLTPLAPIAGLEPEHASSASADLTWRLASVEITTTFFQTSVENALHYEMDGGTFPARIVNADEPTKTRGSEVIARYHADDLAVILTHMYLWSTEFDETTRSRREVPLNPRHSAGFDVLWKIGNTQMGFEAFYTGRQSLDANPYRTTGAPYLLWGILLTHRVGPALLYVNTENLGDVRQTKSNSLLLPQRLRDGRWTTDAWAPLEGRSVNTGIRFQF